MTLLANIFISMFVVAIAMFLIMSVVTSVNAIKDKKSMNETAMDIADNLKRFDFYD